MGSERRNMKVNKLRFHSLRRGNLYQMKEVGRKDGDGGIFVP